MTGQKETSVVLAFYRKYSGLWRGCHQLQLRHLQNVRFPQFDFPGLRYIKDVIQPAEEGGLLFCRNSGVRVNAEQFFIPQHLGHTVVIVESCEGTPADVHGGVYMSGRPVHDPAQLVPVFHFFPWHEGQWCAGDDHAVVGLILDLVEGRIKGIQMAGVCMRRLITGGL